MNNSIKKRFFLVIIASCLFLNLPAQTQKFPFDSLLTANSYSIDFVGGEYSGPGMDFLNTEASKSQFFCLCEEHNLLELNELSISLFEQFNKEYNYNYLVLEQGVGISHFYNLDENRGDFTAIAGLARSYPQSPTFATDEELKLIAMAGEISSNTDNPVWGIDQDLGALHILERLAELAPSEKARLHTQNLADLARKYEMDRIGGDTLFMTMVATPALFAELPELFDPETGSEEEKLIEAIQRSCRIYHNNNLGRRGQAKYYESSSEREHSMKIQFIKNYKKAQSEGDTMPRVYAKMGHYHLLRGIYRLNVPTFGNMLSELAVFNGSSSFILSSFVINSPDKWRGSSEILEKAASESLFTVIDLRPLRPLANQNKIDNLSDSWKEFIFRSDAVLIVKGGQTGNYTIIKSAIQ